MAFLGVIMWIVIILLFLRSIVKKSEQKRKDALALQNLKRDFRLEMLTYARATEKIQKGFVVDSEIEGGELASIYHKFDEEKVLIIIAEFENSLIINDYSLRNVQAKRSAKNKIDLLPPKKDGYIK
jgi:hypothetical protein